MAQMDPELIGKLMGHERNQYSSGYYRIAIGIATEMIDTWFGDYPMIYELRAESYWKLGDFDKAISELETAVQLITPDLEFIYAGTYNNLCWYLALVGEPQDALPHCEKAVSIDPDPIYLDSRGLAYAMLGMEEEAIADFDIVINELGSALDPSLVEIRESREKWVADLEAGVDFNTPEFLEELQADEGDPNALPEPDLLQPEDYTRAHFSQLLKNDGFYNDGVEVNANDVEIETHFIVFNDCTNGVFLVGPEEETWGLQMLLFGCTEDQVSAETLWFLKMLFHPDPHADIDSIEVGQGYAWMVKDVMDVFAGEIDESEAKEIAGILVLGYQSTHFHNT
jgi:tetratricopeptide (TPR) repeat protein